MSYTITDGLIAVYISQDGDIVAAEKIEGERVIAQNLLKAPLIPREGSEILKVEISVDTQVVGDNCCAGSRKFVLLRQCYDKNGRPCPCF